MTAYGSISDDTSNRHHIIMQTTDTNSNNAHHPITDEDGEQFYSFRPRHNSGYLEQHIDHIAASPAVHGPIDEAIIIEDYADKNDKAPTGVLDTMTLLPSIEEAVQLDAPPSHKTLTLWPLAILVFYSVSGGPFGIENAVRYGGPYYAFLGFVFMPFIWSIPEAMITAELGSAYPEASGSVAWVEEAFGSSAGLLCGYFAWISGATDNAIYPALFLGYVLSMVQHWNTYDTNSEVNSSYDDNDTQSSIIDDWSASRFLLLSTLAVCLSSMNYLGLEFVGRSALFIAFLSMSPFILMVLIGLPKFVPGRLLLKPTIPTGQYLNIQWQPFLNNLFWNLNSFDSGGNFAGEAVDSHSTFPKAMFLGVILVVLTYALPLVISLGSVETKQEDWQEGYMGVVASMIGGKWLGVWTVVAAAISNIALYLAELSADAYLLLGMAERNLIPNIFAVRSRYGTPTFGIIVGTAVIIAMSVANFDKLLEMLNFNYCINLLMEYGAFIKLRLSKPHIERPYRVPLGNFGCVLFVLPPTIFILVIIAIASWQTYIVCALMITVGVSVYAIQAYKRYTNWCKLYSLASQVGSVVLDSEVL